MNTLLVDILGIKKGIAVGLNDVLCALHIVSACECVVNEVKKEVSTCALIKENDPIVYQWLWWNDATIKSCKL